MQLHQMAADYGSGAAWSVLGLLLVLILLADIRTLRIPNSLNAALLLSGFVAATCFDAPGLFSSVTGAVLGFGLPYTVAIAYRRLRGADGLGFGDVKFLAGAGAWTGWQGVGPIVLVAALSALMFAAALRFGGSNWDRQTRLAFGPHLCLALALVRAFQSSS